MSHVSVIQMFSNSEGDAAASIDIPEDGKLVGVALNVTAVSVAVDGDGAAVEVSFGSTSSFETNDARQVIAATEIVGNLVGAAANFAPMTATREFDFRDGLQVFAGERIYLHTVGVGVNGAPTRAKAHLLIEFKTTAPGRRR